MYKDRADRLEKHRLGTESVDDTANIPFGHPVTVDQPLSELGKMMLGDPSESSPDDDQGHSSSD